MLAAFNSSKLQSNFMRRPLHRKQLVRLGRARPVPHRQHLSRRNLPLRLNRGDFTDSFSVKGHAGARPTFEGRYSPFNLGFSPLAARKPQARASITVPPVQPILDIILAAQSSIDTGLSTILSELAAVIHVHIDTANTQQVPLIQPIITQGNADMYKEIDAIITGLSGYVDQLVEQASKEEHVLASVSLSVKDIELVNDVKLLIDTLQIDVRNVLQAHGATELSDLTNLIQQSNDSLYTQLTNILNDPENNDPALPQLVFPDPVAIASSILPGKDTLHQDVLNLLKTFIGDVQTLLQSTDTREKDEVTVIMNDGTAELIKKLEDISNKILTDVEAVIIQVTQQEITQVTNAITPIQNDLKINIDNEMDTISTKTTTLIEQVTVDELTQMSTALIQYNQAIAGGLISNLTV